MLNSPTPKTITLQIADNTDLRYEKTDARPPPILTPTIRTRLEYFHRLEPFLAKSHTVYAIDLPGHGHSPIDPRARFDEPYSIPQRIARALASELARAILRS